MTAGKQPHGNERCGITLGTYPSSIAPSLDRWRILFGGTANEDWRPELTWRPERAVPTGGEYQANSPVRRPAAQIQ